MCTLEGEAKWYVKMMIQSPGGRESTPTIIVSHAKIMETSY